MISDQQRGLRRAVAPNRTSQAGSSTCTRRPMTGFCARISVWLGPSRACSVAAATRLPIRPSIPPLDRCSVLPDLAAAFGSSGRPAIALVGSRCERERAVAPAGCARWRDRRDERPARVVVSDLGCHGHTDFLARREPQRAVVVTSISQAGTGTPPLISKHARYTADNAQLGLIFADYSKQSEYPAVGAP